MTTEVSAIEADLSWKGVRRADPDTSKQAAREINTGDRAQALRLHYFCPGGLTDFELASLMKRQQTSAGKRRGELRDLGYVEATAVRRASPSGAKAIVWRITPAGEAACRSFGLAAPQEKTTPSKPRPAAAPDLFGGV